MIRLNYREPTEQDMRIIFPSDAKKLWGHSASRVSGATWLCNDPPQFLDHYYQCVGPVLWARLGSLINFSFAAELLVGLWRTYSSLDLTIDARGTTHLPSPTRMMFPHTAAGKWNDYAKMNSFLSRAIFPSMSYEYQNDFHDRADTARAFLFERVVFADRAAALRGPEFAVTWRTAAESLTLQASDFWWSPIRRNLLDFVGSSPTGRADGVTGVGIEENWASEVDVAELEAEEEDADELTDDMLDKLRKQRIASHSNKPVITYVSRQEWGRRMLRKEAHESLVKELDALREKYGWEVGSVLSLCLLMVPQALIPDQHRLHGQTHPR